MQYIIRLLVVFSAIAFNTAVAQQLSHISPSQQAVSLYQSLHRLSQKYILFGHQDDLAYGVNWQYKSGRSDIKELVNDYPAVYGWDIGKIEHQADKNLDGVPFQKMKDYIREAHSRGGVITISWHLDNPLTGGSSWDTTKNTLESVLPGQRKHELFKLWLDRVADFLASLKDRSGTPIPILFRPFHELTGNWFWWGNRHTSADQIKEIWRFTADYLRKTKKLNHLIMVYNTNDFKRESDFLRCYPGDDYVDILSFDTYQYDINKKQQFIRMVKQQAAVVCKLAKERNKIAAFAETGFENIPDSTWWTGTLLPAIKDYPLAYVLVWRNAGLMPSTQKMHYYAPYKDQQSADDFKKFYQNKRILFEKSLRTKQIYQSK